jgi:DNA-nicking Smr family endonuclease
MAKPKILSSEDRILWGKVARSTRALPGRKADLAELDMGLVEDEKPVAKIPHKTGRISASDMIVTEQVVLQPVPNHKTTHQPLEKPVKRKLAKGHLQLEARIDLHGLVQSEAHVMLHDFLLRAHERGLRHVLIITGKGSSMGSDGALKRAVPMWFSLPEFRYLISSYEPAARGHGGEGALYVRLSRQKGDNT